MSSTPDEGEHGGPEDRENVAGYAGLERSGTIRTDVKRVDDEPEGQDDGPDTIPSLDPDQEVVHKGDRGGAETEPDGIVGPIDEAVEVEAAHDLVSVDDTASIPDDTPSLRGSVLSSPGSETPSTLRPDISRSPSSIHRSLDHRFQSRLASPLSTPRASSPAFLGAHSRRSSLASVPFQGPLESDESAAPWDIIKWTKLRKITGQAFSELGKRNFGRPTCLAVTENIVIGTSKGLVLVFDYQQNHKAIIGAGTKAIECGSVTSLTISADHTTVAAGHAGGHIFTWELSRPARPFLHIPPIDMSLPQGRKVEGHVIGSAVLHVGFLGYRHTALVSADDKGMAFSHLATRGTGPVGRVVKTTRVLGRYPDMVVRPVKRKPSSVLAFAPLPLGNVEQGTDSLGLVAMMTPYLLVIVSTTPFAQTQHKAARPKETTAHGAMSAALAWFPAIKLKGQDAPVSRTKLVYCWSNVLFVLEVSEIPAEDESEMQKPVNLEFLVRSRWETEEAIVGVQWLSRSVLAVLTVTQQLVILEDNTMHTTDTFDLLQKNTYHTDLFSRQLQSVIEQLDEEDTSMHGVVADAFYMSFRAYKGRLFLLGVNDMSWGTLTNWADRLLALIEKVDFIGAIRLATTYHAGEGERATIGLPEDDATRQSLVREKLVELISASLRYAFGRNEQAGVKVLGKQQMVELAEACVSAAVVIDDQEFLFDDVFSWFDEHGQLDIFLDVLQPCITSKQVTSLPPVAIQALIGHFRTRLAPSELEELICLLDTSTMDIDQVTSLCKKYNLYDAYIYVWNKAIGDYVGPLEELLKLLSLDTDDEDNVRKVFPYLSYVLTSRVYPTATKMPDEEAIKAKRQLYSYLFSDSTDGKGLKGRQNSTHRSETSLSPLREILTFDAASFMVVLNEAFEDSYLNGGSGQHANGIADSTDTASTNPANATNRQYIVRVMLDVMSSPDFEAHDTIYLDMFVARSLSKYPQYILLSDTTRHEILIRLCRYPSEEMSEDAQLSVEYLISVYHPPDIMSLVPQLQHARFFRVLKSVFRQEHEYVRLIEAFFLDTHDQDAVFSIILDCLGNASSLTAKARDQVLQVVKEHAADLLAIDAAKTASTIQLVAPSEHAAFLEAQRDDSHAQYDYLGALLESADPSAPSVSINPMLFERYVQLMCRFRPAHVADYVERLRPKDLRLDHVLPAMESSGAIDGVVVLLTMQGQMKTAMERLIQYLTTLKEALRRVIANAGQSESTSASDEAVNDLLDLIDKYAGVGIWLCQGQTKAVRTLRSAPSLTRKSSVTAPLSPEEELWLDFISAAVTAAKELSPTMAGTEAGPSAQEDDQVTARLRQIVQRIFTALLSLTTSSRDGLTNQTDVSFLRVLRAFLTSAAATSPSLSELRSVIASIFSAYTYEESLLALANSMLDKDLFLHVDTVTQLRARGWRPRGQVCEICRRRVWGPGVSDKVWTAWEQKEQQRVKKRQQTAAVQAQVEDLSRGKGKATVHDSPENRSVAAGEVVEDEPGPIMVLSCRHIYHQTCLVTSQAESIESSSRPEFSCPACA